MKIEAGKWYSRRDGAPVGPVPSKDRGSFPWNEDGTYTGPHLPEADPSQYDLVAEWTDEPTTGPENPDAIGTDYLPLEAVLRDALHQAALGKGAERHAGKRPFTDQPIATITRGVGLGFPLGQALKKTQEAAGMVQRGERDAAERDLLGAIVYLAAAVLAIRDGGK